MDTQESPENKDLKELIEGDKQHIIKFLKAFNLNTKENQISIQFSEDLDNPHYLDLWEIGEPSVVKVEFTISNIKSKQPQEIRGILELLINKIQTRDFPNTTGTPYEIHNELLDTTFSSIKIKNNNVTLVGGIFYGN